MYLSVQYATDEGHSVVADRQQRKDFATFVGRHHLRRHRAHNGTHDGTESRRKPADPEHVRHLSGRKEYARNNVRRGTDHGHCLQRTK